MKLRSEIYDPKTDSWSGVIEYHPWHDLLGDIGRLTLFMVIMFGWIPLFLVGAWQRDLPLFLAGCVWLAILGIFGFGSERRWW